jgi:uncharacterized membrane protein
MPMSIPLHREADSSFWRPVLILVVLGLSAGCGGSGSTAPAPPPPPPPPPSSGVTTANLNPLPGDNQSFGMAVNRAGYVAGSSANATGGQQAFYWDGITRKLNSPATRATATGISSGSILYVVGHHDLPAARQAVRWAPQTSADAAVLETIESSAFGVNDDGTAVGSVRISAQASRGTIWPVGGSRIEIPPLAGHNFTTAHAINNQGVVVGTSFGTGIETTDKAWVRLPDARLLELTPLLDDLAARAYGVSDIANGKVTVVGSGTTIAGIRRGVRWTVDAVTGAITSDALTGLRDAMGIAGSGAVAGSTTTQSILWRDGSSLALSGTSITAFARGIAIGSDGSTYVVGTDFTTVNAPAAVFWKIK